MSGHETDIQWFIARDGKQHGPVSDAELKKLVELSHLKATDLVWRQGFTDWRAAVSVFPAIGEPSPASPVAPSAPAPSSTAPPAKQPEASPEPQPAAAPAPIAAAMSQPARAPFSTVQSTTPAAASTHQQPAATTLGTGIVPPAAVAGPKPATETRQAPSEARPSLGGTAPLGTPTVRTAGPLPAPGPSTSPRPDGRAPADIMGPQRRPAYDQPPSSRKKALVIGLVLLGMTGAGALIASRYGDEIFTYVQLEDGEADHIPTVKADVVPSGEASPSGVGGPKLAALDTSLETSAPGAAPPPAAAAGVGPDEVDHKLQSRPMWVAVKQEFPEWYQQRIAEAARLTSEQKDQPEVTRYLIGELVTLRRENARYALAASTVRHKELAAAFLANLKQLAQESGDGCYDFISKGEASATIVARMDDPAKSTEIEKQMTTIVIAIAEGKKQPAEHAAPVKTDYDVLAGELGRLGWTQTDMQLFANPKELAKAPRARVCSMLQDWFTAHLAIQDPSTQERLLFETLKPVISG